MAGTPGVTTVMPDATHDSAWPARRAASLLIAVGTAVAVLGSRRSDVSGAVIVLIGASLATAGWFSRVHRWITAIGLPVLGFALGVGLPAVAPPIAGYRTTAAFVGVGIALLVSDRLRLPAWAAIAGLCLIDLGLAASTLPLLADQARYPGLWLFGVAEALLGAVLMVRVGGPRRQRPMTAVLSAPVRITAPRQPLVQAAAAFIGAVGVAVVERVTANLYEIVLALGVAYLAAGIVARRSRWTESGALITALGAAITLTDFVPAAVAAIDVLVFTAVVAATIVVRAWSLGSIGGVGQSLTVIGIVLAVLAALPATGPIDSVRSNLGVFLPLAPTFSAIAVGLRWAFRRNANANGNASGTQTDTAADTSP